MRRAKSILLYLSSVLVMFVALKAIDRQALESVAGFLSLFGFSLVAFQHLAADKQARRFDRDNNQGDSRNG